MRKVRKFEWERIFGRLAWTAQELAPQLKLSVVCTRRYLRIYYFLGRLERKREGVSWYYAIKRFLSPADEIITCLRCRQPLEIYRKKCGCEFRMCVEDEHCQFNYCKSHQLPSTKSLEVKHLGRKTQGVGG